MSEELEILKRIEKRLEGLEQPEGAESVKKQIMRDSIRISGKLLFASEEERTKLTTALNLLTQALLFATNGDADEAKKLLALSRRVSK